MDKWAILLFGFLPFLLFFAVIFYAYENSGGFLGDGAGSFSIIKTLDSPDGKYAATFWDGMGGGAAGWCGESVNVYKKEEVFDLNRVDENRKNTVLDLRCGSDVTLNWASANHLHVAYSLEYDRTSSLKRSETKDGAVKISYEVK